MLSLTEPDEAFAGEALPCLQTHGQDPLHGPCLGLRVLGGKEQHLPAPRPDETQGGLFCI